jgi:hypothetical protein
LEYDCKALFETSSAGDSEEEKGKNAYCSREERFIVWY